MLNASAICPAAELEKLICGAVDSVSPRFNLELIHYKQECFGMGG